MADLSDNTIIDEYRKRNPGRSLEDIITLMKDHGIKFEICSEEEAIRHLRRNSYFRLSSYKCNYVEGNIPSKYANLDFAYLYDLSKVDTKLRKMILELCINFEHEFKIKLKQYLDENDDGYTIVSEFLSRQTNLSANETYRDTVFIDGLKDKLKTPFLKNLIKEDVLIHEDHPEWLIYTCPYWVFTEIISFGKLIEFYEFIHYPENWNTGFGFKPNTQGKNIVWELNVIRELRNACAHNNCIIANLVPEKTEAQNVRFLTTEVQNWLNSKNDVEFHFSKNMKKVPVLKHLINLFYWIDKILPAKKKHEVFLGFYNDFVNITEHKDYYAGNDYICNAYNFVLGLTKKLLTETQPRDTLPSG